MHLLKLAFRGALTALVYIPKLARVDGTYDRMSEMKYGNEDGDNYWSKHFCKEVFEPDG